MNNMNHEPPSPTTPTTPPKLSNTRSLRLYADDEEEIVELCAVVKQLNRKMDIVDLIRDCVQAGLPVIKKRWEPLIHEENKNAPAAQPGAN